MNHLPFVFCLIFFCVCAFLQTSEASQNLRSWKKNKYEEFTITYRKDPDYMKGPAVNKTDGSVRHPADAYLLNPFTTASGKKGVYLTGVTPKWTLFNFNIVASGPEPSQCWVEVCSMNDVKWYDFNTMDLAKLWQKIKGHKRHEICRHPLVGPKIEVHYSVYPGIPASEFFYLKFEGESCTFNAESGYKRIMFPDS